MKLREILIGMAAMGLLAIGALAFVFISQSGSAQGSPSAPLQAAGVQQSASGVAPQEAPAQQAPAIEKVDVVPQGQQQAQPAQQAQAPQSNPANNPAAEPTEAAEPAQQAPAQKAPASQARITQQQAEHTALTANPGTTVLKTDLDSEDGAIVYEVELSNGTDVKVNAQTGAIMATDTPDSDDAAKAQAPASQARITQQQAEHTALTANPGTTVKKTELDDEDGAAVYEVELSNGTDVKVNAQTGAIISTDTPDSEDVAKAQALASQARITQQQAERTALAANPGTTVKETKLDDKDGTVIYKVELSNGNDVTVNAQTGAIMATDTPDSDD